MVTRRTTFRLYPTKAQEKVLYGLPRWHCYVDNSALADRKDSYNHEGKSVNYLDQQNRLPAFKEVWVEYKKLGSQALQATLKRVDFAEQRCFTGKGGSPQFKSIHQDSGPKALTDGMNGYLDLSNLGKNQMRGKRRVWGTPTTTLQNRPGKWYASITVNCQVVREVGSSSIGLDVGVAHAVAMSDGELIDAPKFLAKASEPPGKASQEKRRKRDRCKWGLRNASLRQTECGVVQASHSQQKQKHQEN